MVFVWMSGNKPCYLFAIRFLSNFLNYFIFIIVRQTTVNSCKIISVMTNIEHIVFSY